MKADWQEYVVVLPRKEHTYSWTIRNSQAGQPDVYIDTFECFDEVSESVESFDFDDGARPPAMSGEWVIDNAHHHGDGQSNIREVAARAPTVESFMRPWMTLECEQEHTLMSFFYAAQVKAGQAFGLEVDGDLFMDLPDTGIYATDYAWEQYAVAVSNPPAAQAYTWFADTEPSGRPVLFVDSVECQNFDVLEGAVRTDFDKGAIPSNVSGDWTYDNTNIHNDGDEDDVLRLSARPPFLEEGDTVELVVECNHDHKELTFEYAANLGAGDKLECQIDEEAPTPLEETGIYALQWRFDTMTRAGLDEASHTYRWRFTAGSAGRPEIWIDTIDCL